MRISWLTSRNDLIFLFVFCGWSFLVQAEPIQDAVNNFVRAQLQGTPGEISINVGHIDNLANFSGCQQQQIFLPPGARLLGNTSVGVRCLAPATWSLFVPVRIGIVDRYLVTQHAVASGQPLLDEDLNELRGDLANLPAGTLTRREQALGKAPRFNIGPGQILRSEQLVSLSLIKQNQSVRMVVRGNGFSASSEGKALNNAGVGQVVQLRTASGSVVSGIVQDDGSVSVSAGN